MHPSLLGTAARYLLEVARVGSVNGAAGQLHVAASAISRQITKLEEAVGCALFERRPRGMVLNEAGEKLCAYIRTVSLDTQFLLEEIREVSRQGANRIRIATTEGFSMGLMPDVMAGFRARYPETSIHLQVGSPSDVADLLRRGEVDLALKYCVAPEPGLRVAHIGTAPVMALVCPTHRLARLRTVSITDMIQYPIALPDKDATARQVFDLCCSTRGIDYTAAYVGNSSIGVSLAIRGEVATIAGYLSAADTISSGRLVALPFIERPFMERSVQVLTMDSHTPRPVVQNFLEQLVTAIERARKEAARLMRRVKHQE